MTTAMHDRLIELLVQALNDEGNRSDVIREFQRLVWESDEVLGNEASDEAFRDLAHDLDYYEPDAELRREDRSFYGDDRVEEELRSGVARLRASGMRLPSA